MLFFDFRCLFTRFRLQRSRKALHNIHLRARGPQGGVINPWGDVERYRRRSRSNLIDCLSQSVGWQLGSHGDGTSNSIMETKMEARLAGAGKQYKMFSVSKTQSSPNYRKLRVIDQSKRFSRCPNPSPLSYSDSYRKLRAIMRTWGS